MVTTDQIQGIWKTAKVMEFACISYSTLYRLEKAGRFPKKRRISPNTVGYLASEIIEWMSNLETAEESPVTVNCQR